MVKLEKYVLKRSVSVFDSDQIECVLIVDTDLLVKILIGLKL